jgi:hypothetical protein
VDISIVDGIKKEAGNNHDDVYNDDGAIESRLR